MIDLATALTAAALALPPPYGDREPADERAERVERIASASAAAAENQVCTEPPRRDSVCWPGPADELGVLVLLKAHFESGGFSRAVHEAGPRPDRGGYAISLWSLHSWRLVPYSEWKWLGGIGRTEAAASAAARVLSFARNHCGADRRDWPEATISLYATGKRCTWKGAAPRARFFRKVLADVRSPSRLT